VADRPIRVLLLEQIHPDAEEILRSAGFEVEAVPRALDEDELVERIGEVTLLGIRSKTHVTARVLDAAPNLLGIGAL
jgi:D-3-phosphoglycerate dehydrogenase